MHITERRDRRDRPSTIRIDFQFVRVIRYAQSWLSSKLDKAEVTENFSTVQGGSQFERITEVLPLSALGEQKIA